MEIDCNDKIDKNEKILAKEILIDVGDKNIEKCCEIVDKKQKLDMVANTQDSNTVVTKTEELTDDVASSEDAATSTPAESTTATVTEDADGVDSGGGGGSDTEVEFVTKVDDSEDCDNNKIDKSKEEHKSQKDSASGSSTEMEEKQICEEILLVPMTITSVESQDVEEEECEKSFLISSSPLKGSGGGNDVELISDIDDYNEEEDNIDGNGEREIIGEEEDYENDTSSLTSNLDNNKPVNPTKSSSDLDEDDDDDEDDSESDEFSEEDGDDNDEDDVIELVPDSSDEDDNNVVQQNVSSSRHHNIPITTDDYEIEDDDDDGDDEYDDDDLMDDVVMSSKKIEQNKPEKVKVNNKCEIPRKKEPEQFKKKARWDYRTQLKKRSVKWLINKIRKETVTGVQYVYQSGSGPNIVNKGSSSKTQYTPVKSSQSFNEEVELISIDLDDSPEKLQPTQSGHTLSKQLKESSPSSSSSSSTSTPTRVRQKLISDMQQVDKIRDSIQNAEDLKQQQHVKSIKDEQNKENVENNDKLLSKSLKLNGSVGTSRTDKEKTKQKNDDDDEDDDDDDDDDDEDDDDDNDDNDDDEECNDKVEIIMDISTEDEDKTLEQNIVKKLTEEEVKKKNAQPKDNENKCENSRENAEKDKKKRNEINKVSITNEAVKSEMNVCENIEMAQDKNICKDSQETDLKKSPPTKRVRSASLEETTKQENIHPTKKLRAELESNFPTHDKILSEYIEKTSNNSVDEIQKHINQLIIEIQTINDMIKAKEIEWNNMLHLKKVKEEICFRLSRKRQMMEIVSTKIGEANLPINDDVAINETILQNSSVKPTKLYASTPNVSAVTANFSSSILNNLSNAAIISGNNNMSAAINNTSSSCGSTAQSILHNRANMKSSDLAKEKANTQRLHRLLVSRNILPKPSSSTSTAVAGFGASTQVSIPKISSTSAILATTAATTSLAGGGGGGNNMMHIPLHALSSGTAASFGLTSNGALSSQQPILNSYLTAAATVQQQLGEMLNGHHNPLLNQQNNTNGSQTLMVGRQGVFKDVKSIIADYRQRHPEQVPRRGRRVKSNPSATDSSSILSNVLKNDGKLSNTTDLGALLQKFDGNSRPSSNDSSHSMTNLIGASGNNTNLGNVSFKDVLVQFAKMSGQTDRFGTGTTIGNKLMGNSTTTTSSGGGGGGTQSAPPPPYPEVTLHPVSTSQSNIDQTGSLLHGILTKYTRPNVTSTPSVAPTSTSQTAAASQNFSSTFSPTLARLLTAPERINTGGGGHNTQTSSNSYQANLQAVQSAVAGSGLNLSKVVGHNSEITITPVITSQPLQQTLLQQQLQQQQQHLKDAIRDRVKSENLLNLDDEADDSVDRLVIDEGGDSAGIDEHHRIAPHAIGQEFHENEVPACQGCKKQEAQFVCAGCGNQWYCSRECQVAAWDDHSEVCTG